MEIIEAVMPEQIEAARSLFEEYAASLDFNLCFQNFAEELAQLPGDYAPPHGCLLLAVHDDSSAGCIALRFFAEKICEMKRLYVRPAFRSLGVGHHLVETLILAAQRMDYEKMVLDTVGTMQNAQALYEAFGFVDTAPYYYNPLPEVRFMARNL